MVGRTDSSFPIRWYTYTLFISMPRTNHIKHGTFWNSYNFSRESVAHCHSKVRNEKLIGCESNQRMLKLAIAFSDLRQEFVDFTTYADGSFSFVIQGRWKHFKLGGDDF